MTRRPPRTIAELGETLEQHTAALESDLDEVKRAVGCASPEDESVCERLDRIERVLNTIAIAVGRRPGRK